MAKEKVKVNVIHGEQPVERNVLAQAIVEISGAMRKLTASGLNRDAVIVLVRDKLNGIGKREIRLVFDALADLEREFCR